MSNDQTPSPAQPARAPDNTGAFAPPAAQSAPMTGSETAPTTADGAAARSADLNDADQRHPVRFTGSGSEYFRIWIVNLLLTFVTLGIYYPWAKVRKLRYFYGNTQVAGHALDFHGQPRQMLRGYGIVSLLFVVYSIASQFDPVAGLIALVLLAAIWPALLRAGQRFRMAQTSWRGMRFRFAGSTADAYKALLPIAVPALAVLGAAAFIAPEANDEGKVVMPSSSELTFFLGLLPLLIFGAVPAVWWSIKRFQHGNYALGRMKARFTASVGSFYAVFGKTFLLTLAVALVGGMVAAIVMAGGGPLSAIADAKDVRKLAGFVFTALLLLFMVAAIQWLTRPYFMSRMQNLVWNHTDSASIGFESKLRFRPLLLLSLKNWLLMALTLGLYWPFAAIAMARMRTQAVTVIAHRDLDMLVQDTREAMKDATGDAAGDMFDIDLGM